MVAEAFKQQRFKAGQEKGRESERESIKKELDEAGIDYTVTPTGRVTIVRQRGRRRRRTGRNRANR